MHEPKFSEVFCARYAVRHGAFERSVLRRVLCPHARLLAPLCRFFRRGYFASDLDFIPRFILAAVLILACIQPYANAQSSLNLGAAGNFAVLAGSGITVAGAVGSTSITGDIGSFPTASITGLGNVILTGTDQAGDADTQAAQNDLQSAYNTAVAATPTETFTAASDLGGLTLAAGIYNDPSSFAVTGTLKLDAQGNPNAVWIIQTGSTLITANNSQILLINGAQAANVFWQVGSSATMGTLTSFVGSVLAETSITMTTGAKVDGQLLALNGAVTLDVNDIAIAGTIPEPAGTALLIAGCLGLMVAAKVRAARQPLRQQQPA